MADTRNPAMNDPDRVCMDDTAERCPIGKPLLRIILFLPGFSVVLPVFIAIVSDISLSQTMALVGSAFLIEYGAVVPGIALGIDVLPLFLIIFSVALSVILTSFEIFHLLSTRSARICRFLERVQNGKYTGFISRYGVWGLVPGIIIVGFYVCPAISWIFSWQRRSSIILMMTGYLVAALATYLAATGLIRVIFS